MTVDPAVLAAIAGMALISYATRAGGLWLTGRRSAAERLEPWLRELPGPLLVAITVPAAVESGVGGSVAAVAALLVALRSRSVLAALVAGVLAAQLARALIGWF